MTGLLHGLFDSGIDHGAVLSCRTSYATAFRHTSDSLQVRDADHESMCRLRYWWYRKFKKQKQKQKKTDKRTNSTVKVRSTNKTSNQQTKTAASGSIYVFENWYSSYASACSYTCASLCVRTNERMYMMPSIPSRCRRTTPSFNRKRVVSQEQQQQQQLYTVSFQLL